MNIDLEDGETPSGEGAKSVVRPSDECMQKGVVVLTTGTFTALDACTKPVLFYLSQDRSLRRASTKCALIKTLLSWVLVLGPWSLYIIDSMIESQSLNARHDLKASHPSPSFKEDIADRCRVS
jgi:hypothetical protein